MTDLKKPVLSLALSGLCLLGVACFDDPKAYPQIECKCKSSIAGQKLVASFCSREPGPWEHECLYQPDQPKEAAR